MKHLRMRSAEATDSAALFHNYAKQGWTSFSQDLIERLLQTSHWLVLELDGQVIGSARYLTDGVRTVYVCELLVVSEHRRKAFGRQLMTELRRLYPTLRIDLISDADHFYDSLKMTRRGMGYRSKPE